MANDKCHTFDLNDRISTSFNIIIIILKNILMTIFLLEEHNFKYKTRLITVQMDKFKSSR